MPPKSDAWREIFGGIGQGLTIVAEAEIECDITAEAKTVLHEKGIQPLLEQVRGHSEADRLRVLLNVGERQLIQRSSRRISEGERTQDRGARLAAESSPVVKGTPKGMRRRTAAAGFWRWPHSVAA